MSAAESRFRLADIGGELGVGEVAEQIVASLGAYDNEVLQAALMKEANPELTAALTDEDREFIDSIADGTLISCSVVDQGPYAVVVYMEEDHRGDLLKGCIPLTNVRQRSKRGHVSQAGELQKTAAAGEHRDRERLRDRAAATVDDELTQENEELRRLLEAAQSQQDASAAAEKAAADAKAKAAKAEADAQKTADDLAQAEEERVAAEQDASEKAAEIEELKRQLAEAQEAATAPAAAGPPPATPGGADAVETRPAARRATRRS